MRTLGRYAILGLLGRGGMGAVYKAAMPRTGRVVAVKVLKPAEVLAATADAALLRRDFFREAALMAAIRHPNIAQVLDVDEASVPAGAGSGAGGNGETLPFFVMEYYCNNLGALLGEGYRVEEPTRRLGVDQALSCARQLASALARLHHEGIIHRDVKPFNLMLAERAPDTCQPGLFQADEVKLIDFGLSRLRGEQGPARPRGAVVGSPYYAAPAQEADPETADERADVFSAGVTLFRCLTGRLPQEGLPASALRAGLDERFDAFFARACNEDRRERPASARDLLAELDGLGVHWASLRQRVCSLPQESSTFDA
ncbi:MAG: serine/threonine-protein kinase, partial [Humidesulfovibrio sp.]|nr:serine/threonine-protein kinase [Humidesulfovibrio sp.]